MTTSDIGFSKAAMQRAMNDDIAFNRERRNPGREGLAASVDIKAVANAVLSEGHGVLSREGRGYWRDMYRRYPHLRVMDGRPREDGRSVNGRSCRLGKVSLRRREDGRWERWTPQGFVVCPPGGPPR